MFLLKFVLNHKLNCTDSINLYCSESEQVLIDRIPLIKQLILDFNKERSALIKWLQNEEITYLKIREKINSEEKLREKYFKSKDSLLAVSLNVLENSEFIIEGIDLI